MFDSTGNPISKIRTELQHEPAARSRIHAVTKPSTLAQMT